MNTIFFSQNAQKMVKTKIQIEVLGTSQIVKAYLNDAAQVTGFQVYKAIRDSLPLSLHGGTSSTAPVTSFEDLPFEIQIINRIGTGTNLNRYGIIKPCQVTVDEGENVYIQYPYIEPSITLYWMELKINKRGQMILSSKRVVMALIEMAMVDQM